MKTSLIRQKLKDHYCESDRPLYNWELHKITSTVPLSFRSPYIQFILAVLRVSVAVLVYPVPTSIRSRTFLHPSRPRISFNPGPGEILLQSKDYRSIVNFKRCRCVYFSDSHPTPGGGGVWFFDNFVKLIYF